MAEHRKGPHAFIYNMIGGGAYVTTQYGPVCGDCGRLWSHRWHAKKRVVGRHRRGRSQ